MIEVFGMTVGHPYWEKTIQFAQACPWRAGPYLANEMRKNTFHDWERVFAAVIDGEIVGFCTFTKSDELPESYGYSPFIGFVFVGEEHRGNRLSERMIEAAAEYAGQIGFEKLFIMSGEKGLYEKYGFRKIGDFPTIFNTTDQLFERSVSTKG